METLTFINSHCYFLLNIKDLWAKSMWKLSLLLTLTVIFCWICYLISLSDWQKHCYFLLNIKDLWAKSMWKLSLLLTLTIIFCWICYLISLSDWQNPVLMSELCFSKLNSWWEHDLHIHVQTCHVFGIMMAGQRFRLHRCLKYAYTTKVFLQSNVYVVKSSLLNRC